MRAAVERVLASDFDRVLMAHGDPIERDGRARVQEALAWIIS